MCAFLVQVVGLSKARSEPARTKIKRVDLLRQVEVASRSLGIIHGEEEHFSLSISTTEMSAAVVIYTGPTTYKL